MILLQFYFNLLRTLLSVISEGRKENAFKVPLQNSEDVSGHTDIDIDFMLKRPFKTSKLQKNIAASVSYRNKRYSFIFSSAPQIKWVMLSILAWSSRLNLRQVKTSTTCIIDFIRPSLE